MANIGVILSSSLISAALSAAAASLLAKDKDEPLVDEKPTTLATRGSRHPQIIGTRRVAPILCEAGARDNIAEAAGSSGKGFSGAPGAEQDVWYERGWHVICIGPAQRLYRIWEDGEEVFNGEMNPSTHPSGTPFHLNGGFDGATQSGSTGRIYWGEKDQDSDPVLSARAGITSRWPYTMYIYWDKKRLGGFPRWPAMEYEVEVWPYRPSMDTVAGNLAGFLEHQSGVGYPVTHPARLTQSQPIFKGTILSNINSPAIRRVVNGDGGGGYGTPPGGGLFAEYGARMRLALADGSSLDGAFPDGGLFDVSNQLTPSVNGRYTTFFSRWVAGETFTYDNGSLGYDTDQKIWRDFFTTNGQAGGGNWQYTNTAYNQHPSNIPIAQPSSFPLPAPDSYSTFNRAYRIDASTSFGGVDNIVAHQADSPENFIEETYFQYRAQIWIWNPWATRPAGDDYHRIGLTIGDNRHGAWFTFSSPTQVSSVGNNGGTVVSAEALNDEWWRLEVQYVVGDGEPRSTSGAHIASVHFGNYSQATGAHVICYLPQGANGPEFSHHMHNKDPGGTSFPPGVLTVWPAEDMHNFHGHTGNAGALVEVDSHLGINALHIMYQLMFETPPHGRGLDPDLYDLVSMEDVARKVGLEGEELRSHVMFQAGEKYDKILGNINLDLGLFITWDFETGKYKFVLVREQDPESVPIIPAEWVLPDLPEITTNHRPNAPNRLVYGYPKVHRYREEPITIDDDSKAIEGIASQNSDIISLVLPTDPETAAKISERRASEVLDGISNYSLKLHKDGRLLKAGDVRLIDPGTGIRESLLVITNKLDESSGRADIQCTTDTYALGAQQINPPESPSAPSVGLLISPTWDVVEAPAQLSEGRLLLWVPYVSRNPETSAAWLWASQDDSSYNRLFSKPTRADSVLFTITEWPFTGAMEETWGAPMQGVSIDFPMITQQNDAQWRDGQLSALIVSDAGFEVVFIKGYYIIGSHTPGPPGEVLPGGLEPIDEEQTRRFGDVIRGRLGTEPLTHPEGARCYVMNYRRMSPIADSFVREGETQFFKLQTRAGHAVDDISVLDSTPYDVVGAAVRAPEVCGLRQTGLRPLATSWQQGTNLDIAWTWKHHKGRTSRTGAGYSTAGVPVAPLDPLRTLIEVRDNAQVLVRTLVLTGSTWEYSAALMSADIGIGQTMHISVSTDVPEAAVAVLTLAGE